MKIVTRSSRNMGNEATTEQAELVASRFIAQRETGPWNEADAAALQSWIREAPLHRVVYFRLHAAWQDAGRLTALKGPMRDEARSPVGRAVPGAALWALAASMILVVAGALAWYAWPAADRYVTSVGGLQTIPLADGSRITLNTDTKLRVHLGKTERRIDLDRGEAFFEVVHEARRPFVVYAGPKRVIAIGTRFTVRREDNNDIQVAVTEGTVRYEDPSPRVGNQHTQAAGTAESSGAVSALVLPAGSLAHSEAGNVLVKKEPVPQIEQTLSWLTGVLTFHDTPIAAAVAEFNRYNTRQIVIDDPRVGALEVGGIFGATRIDSFVHLLEGGFPIEAREEGATIVLTLK